MVAVIVPRRTRPAPKEHDEENTAMGTRRWTTKPATNPGAADNGETLSGREILAILTVLALVCAGGYFLLMKLVAISQWEDGCMFGGHSKACRPEVIDVR
jgi:hypothetical protein